MDLLSVLKIKLVKIDNIMLTRKLRQNYAMDSILKSARFLLQKDYFIYYEDERLNTKGIYLTPKNKSSRSSYILYRTGSSTVMGAKSKFDIKVANKIVKKIYFNIVKPTKQSIIGSDGCDYK